MVVMVRYIFLNNIYATLKIIIIINLNAKKKKP